MDDVWALADKVAIMRDGRLEQLDTTEGVFTRPTNQFVAGFVGASVFEGTVLSGSNGTCRVDVQGLVLKSVDSGACGDCVRVALRPEDVIVFGERPANSSIQNLVQATLEDYYKEGILYHLSFRCGDLLIPAVVTTSAFHEMDLRRDATKYLGVKAANVKLT